MDENYGQSPNSITAGRTRKRKSFPAVPDGSGDTMIERAMRTAEKMRGVSKPKDKGEETPKSTTAKRTQFAKPPKPDTSAGGGKGKVSPEEQRGQSISQALLKGAAMVPESRYSGTLRGLLGGASVGLDIGTALDKYRRQKLDETAASAAMKMSENQEANWVPPPKPPVSTPQALQDFYGRGAGPQVKRLYRKRDELAGGEYNPQVNV